MSDAQIDPIMFACAFCSHVAHPAGCTKCDCTEGVFAGVIPAVTVPLAPVGWFITDALNRLPDPAWAVEHDEPPSCCTVCCGPCAGLRELQATGQLDAILRAHHQRTGTKLEGWSWWDTDRDEVDRAYLDERIDDSKCWNVESHAAILAQNEPGHGDGD